MTPELKRMQGNMWIERILCFFSRSHRDHRLIDLDGYCVWCLQKVRDRV